MKEILDTLNIFHDGIIEGCIGDNKELQLRISCSYLAELETKGNEYFFLTIRDIKRFEFHYWNGIVIDEIQDMIKLDLEIGYSKIEDNIIKTSCYSWLEPEGNMGGELRLISEFRKLTMQNGETMSIEELNDLSKIYWDSLNT